MKRRLFLASAGLLTAPSLARAQQRIASSAYLPNLALAASYGVQGDRYRFNSRNDVGLASLVMSWNAFNGGQDAARREQANATRSEAEYRRREAERAIALQVGNAYDAVQSARSTLTTASDRLASAERANQAHELRFPFGLRQLVTAWKWLFFVPQRAGVNPQASAEVNRGAYIAGALSHCTECHTPRNFLGGPVKGRLLGGGMISEGRAPNLTPTRLKRWSDAQLKEFLRSGATPEGDVPAEAMEEIIRNTTSQLSPQDLGALVAYLRSLPPLAEEKR
jgi:mono/diheme cytochrome c family protein